jgi:hypothetical protein
MQRSEALQAGLPLAGAYFLHLRKRGQIDRIFQEMRAL